MQHIQVGARAQFVMIVSDDDYRFLRNWRWTFARSHPGLAGELIYARRGVIVQETIDGLRGTFDKRFDLFVHHVVLARMGYPEPPQPRWTADHIGIPRPPGILGTLDNRRENLRWASPSFQAKRQRARAHGEWVQQALAAMIATHTCPVHVPAPDRI